MKEGRPEEEAERSIVCNVGKGVEKGHASILQGGAYTGIASLEANLTVSVQKSKDK